MTDSEQATAFEIAMLARQVKDISGNQARLRKRIQRLEALLQLTALDPYEGREDETED